MQAAKGKKFPSSYPFLVLMCLHHIQAEIRRRSALVDVFACTARQILLTLFASNRPSVDQEIDNQVSLAWLYWLGFGRTWLHSLTSIPCRVRRCVRGAAAIDTLAVIND